MFWRTAGHIWFRRKCANAALSTSVMSKSNRKTLGTSEHRELFGRRRAFFTRLDQTCFKTVQHRCVVFLAGERNSYGLTSILIEQETAILALCSNRLGKASTGHLCHRQNALT